MRPHLRRLGIAAGVAAVLVVACDGSESQLTDIPREAPIGIHYLLSEGGHYSGSAELGERIRAAEERYGWIVRLHTEAIREAHRERLSWSKEDRRSVSKICSQATRLGIKYSAKIDGALGVPLRSEAAHLGTVRQALGFTKRCKGPEQQPSPLSIFRNSAVLPTAVTTVEISSELQAKLDEAVLAFTNSGDMGYEILSALDTVIVAGAQVLTEPDFEILIAQAQLSMSSLVEWQTLWDAGNWPGSGGGGGEEGDDPMSLFKSQLPWSALHVYWYFQFHPNARRVAVADAAGLAIGWIGGPTFAAASGIITSIAVL